MLSAPLAVFTRETNHREADDGPRREKLMIAPRRGAFHGKI